MGWGLRLECMLTGFFGMSSRLLPCMLLICKNVSGIDFTDFPRMVSAWRARKRSSHRESSLGRKLSESDLVVSTSGNVLLSDEIFHLWEPLVMCIPQGWYIPGIWLVSRKFYDVQALSAKSIVTLLPSQQRPR